MSVQEQLDNLGTLKVSELRLELERFNLPSTGLKPELRDRLRTHLNSLLAESGNGESTKSGTKEDGEMTTEKDKDLSTPDKKCSDQQQLQNQNVQVEKSFKKRELDSDVNDGGDNDRKRARAAASSGGGGPAEHTVNRDEIAPHLLRVLVRSQPEPEQLRDEWARELAEWRAASVARRPSATAAAPTTQQPRAIDKENRDTLHELLVYVWSDTTLRELTNLVREGARNNLARRPTCKLQFHLARPSVRGPEHLTAKPVAGGRQVLLERGWKYMGNCHAVDRPTDNRSLIQCGLRIGDVVDCELIPFQRPAPPVGDGGAEK